MQNGDAAEAWLAAHEALVELAREKKQLDFEEGRWLLAARRAKVHRELGHGSFTQYVERLFGYSPRLTHDKLRVAEALEGLPKLATELREGALSFSHVRELTRVATPETEDAWLERARGCSAREVEKLVSGRRLGSGPDAPAEPHLCKKSLHFEVSGETLAIVREAEGKLRREAGEHLDDDALLLMMARYVLGGPSDDGRASYQVALDVCEDCLRARQLADGELVDVSPTVTAMARCDAQHLPPNAHVGDLAGGAAPRAAQDVAPGTRRLVLRRDRHRCRVPGCSHATWVDVHHLQARADAGDHSPNNLLTLCGAHHRAVHEGTLVIAGTLSSGLVFSHADGTPYGELPSASSSRVQALAFRALCGLGFRERDARHALTQILQASKADATVESVLREAVALLTERACTKVY